MTPGGGHPQFTASTAAIASARPWMQNRVICAPAQSSVVEVQRIRIRRSVVIRLLPTASRPDPVSWSWPGGAGAQVPGDDESGQPGLSWPEFLPRSGDLQYRDRRRRELGPDPVERTPIAGPAAGERQC